MNREYKILLHFDMTLRGFRVLLWKRNLLRNYMSKLPWQRLYFLRKLRRARAPTPSCAPSTEAPSRASWLAASLCGMAPATRPAASPFNGQWEQLRRSLVSLSPPSRTSTAPVSPAKPSALQVIPPTRHTASSVCYHQGGDWGVSKPGPTDWKTASSTRLSGSWTPSRPCPPPLFYPTQHWTLTLRPPPPPQLPPPAPPPPPLTNCDPHQSLCAALDWSPPHPALSVNYLFWQSDKRLFFFCTTHICTVLFYLTGLHSICHVPYATLSISFLFIFIFLQCPHLYICIVCMYIWLNCIYLYLNVYCQCLMLTVCTKGLRVTQFQFSVCMYCTCGRIDNKADLTWLEQWNAVIR